ncbi:PP2C family protein-serine/threonine phosphatase [Tundrisphaera lichenicola]|uniref:PP2C family protein-serine/threonine phosphatase n=1 Tax=Tundrisphaera lichenicola TaxID=2029860 RepID=UPI003EBDD001
MTDGLGSVLIVDDDANNRDLLSRRLQRLGYEATVAQDGQHALSFIGERPFDVILLDVMMPGLDGFEVLKIIREHHIPTALPVIMATAKDDSGDVIHALGLGANDYVTKPFDFPVVVARIQTQIALKRAVDQVHQLERRLSERNRDLESANSRMSRDLRAAARIQEALLPRSSPEVPGLGFSWAFRPCDELAGDGLSAIKLADHLAAIYVLDVSGHGVASALMSVSLGRLLSPPTDASSILIRGGEGEDRLEPLAPAEVAGRLNRLFPFELSTEQYSTLAYGILNSQTGEFRYTLAGHPGPIHLSASGARVLTGRGYPIGLGDGPKPYNEWSVMLEAGDRIYLFSDGIPEAVNDSGDALGSDRLLRAVEAGRSEPLCSVVNQLVAAVESWSGVTGVRDDVSILAVEFRGLFPSD